MNGVHFVRCKKETVQIICLTSFISLRKANRKPVRLTYGFLYSFYPDLFFKNRTEITELISIHIN